MGRRLGVRAVLARFSACAGLLHIRGGKEKPPGGNRAINRGLSLFTFCGEGCEASRR
jgi:hypothetical protein